MAFTGFSDQSISFLTENKKNNSKTWFEDHREQYNQYVLDPLKELTLELTDTILSIDNTIDVTPSVNRTISRIHRDIRFSKDKSLYRDEMWISFRKKKTTIEVPEFYIYVTPEIYDYGMGYYCISRKTMDMIREGIEYESDRFLKITRFLDDEDTTLQLVGQEYRKALPNSAPEKLQPWFRKKNIAISCRQSHDDILYSSKLQTEVERDFRILKDLYLFFIENTFS